MISNLLRIAGAILVMASIAAARTYHLDATSGNDSADGLSPRTAWRSLEKFNATLFQPGDVIRFRCGQRWTGQLRPQGSGTAENPITIGSDGEGALPLIEGEGKFRETVLIQDVEHWTITRLAVTNRGETTAPDRSGVRIQADRRGAMHGITLRGLHVHDVNGDLRKSHEGHGILFESNSRTGAFFDGLLIEECKLERTDRNGICQRGLGRTRSVRVVIRSNILEDIGGDGIKLWGTNGGLIEYNTVRNCRARCQDHAAGIWPFACDDTIVQFNVVSGTKGTKDGQGYDSDYQCRRTIIQNNYSYDNEGGFILICSPGNSYNEDTIVRHNVSFNDGIDSARVIQIGGNPSNTHFYENSIILGKGRNLPVVSFNEWDRGYASSTRFSRNWIFAPDGSRGNYVLKGGKGTVFTDNWFIGDHQGLPEGTRIFSKNPDGTWRNLGTP